MTEEKKHYGRPLLFETVEALQAGIDDYFLVTPVDEQTWTGLAYHLNTSKETLREYRERPGYVDPLKKALLRIERGYEIDLKKHGRSGTIFALKNFDWKDKQESEVYGKNGEALFPKPIMDVCQDDSNKKDNSA